MISPLPHGSQPPVTPITNGNSPLPDVNVSSLITSHARLADHLLPVSLVLRLSRESAWIFSISPAERAALEEPAVTRRARILAVVDHDLATRQNSLRRTFNLHAFISAVVHIHMMSLRREGHLFIGIKDYNVRVRTDRYRPFTGEQAEDLRRRG